MANLHMCRNLHMNMFRCDLRGRQSWSMVRNRRTWRLQCTLRCYRARFEQGINCAYTCACVCECVSVCSFAGMCTMVHLVKKVRALVHCLGSSVTLVSDHVRNWICKPIPPCLKRFRIYFFIVLRCPYI